MVSIKPREQVPILCPFNRPGLPAPWWCRSQATAPSAPAGTIGAAAARCWRWAPATSTRRQALDLAQLGTGQQRPGRHALDRLGTGPPAAPAPRRAHGRACRPRGATAARLTHQRTGRHDRRPCGLLALVPTSTSSAPTRPAAPAPRRAHGRACRPRGATAARLTHPAAPAGTVGAPAGCWRWAPATSTPAPGGRPSTSTSSAPTRPAAPAPRRAHGRACRPRGAAAARLTHPAHHPPRSAPLQAAGAGRRPAAPGGKPSTSTSSAPTRPPAPAPQHADGRACRPRGATAAKLTHPAHHPTRSAPLRVAGAGADLDQLGADPAGSASASTCPR